MRGTWPGSRQASICRRPGPLPTSVAACLSTAEAVGELSSWEGEASSARWCGRRSWAAGPPLELDGIVCASSCPGDDVDRPGGRRRCDSRVPDDVRDERDRRRGRCGWLVAARVVLPMAVAPYFSVASGRSRRWPWWTRAGRSAMVDGGGSLIGSSMAWAAWLEGAVQLLSTGKIADAGPCVVSADESDRPTSGRVHPGPTLCLPGTEKESGLVVSYIEEH